MKGDGIVMVMLLMLFAGVVAAGALELQNSRELALQKVEVRRLEAEASALQARGALEMQEYLIQALQRADAEQTVNIVGVVGVAGMALALVLGFGLGVVVYARREIGKTLTPSLPQWGRVRQIESIQGEWRPVAMKRIEVETSTTNREKSKWNSI